MYGSWIEVNKDALLHNIQLHKDIFAPLEVAFVIKGNGYGHDMQLVAQVCQQSPAVNWLCVASISEALLLRACGITKSLLVLSVIDAPLEKAALHDIDVVIHSDEHVAFLMKHGKSFKKPLNVHLKIDTGLSRLGWNPKQLTVVIEQIKKIPTIQVVGVFTHFADRNDPLLVCKQLSDFSHAVDALLHAGYKIPFRHITGTLAIKDNPAPCTMVRIGLGMYGIAYDEESKALPLKGALQWKATIMQVKKIQAGAFVSYGSYKQVDRDTLIAIIPVGYADGYPLSLSNKGSVLISGKQAPILGRVTMNLIILDVTDIPHVKPGDQVLIMGDNEHVHPHTMALKASSIAYEIITKIGPHIPRILI